MRTNFDFTSLNVKNKTSHVIGIISATEKKKIYDVVDIAVRAKFPQYFERIPHN